ncbi:MAG TPA: hypothetical protein VND64_11195 [Pirellulales bacterium]|nr:hypothetical protein [Pirellulales bacterium]
MARPKEPKTHPTSRGSSIGLMAFGSSGLWEIAIDQTTSGTDRWFAQIEGPSVYLYFEIPSLGIIDQAMEFLACCPGKAGRNPAHNSQGGTLPLGASKSMQVNLIRDDEFSDRYFLVIEPKHELSIRFTLTGDDLKNVENALLQAKDDLE